MRVNISYSVELDDIPEKVSELASKEISLMKKELIPSLEDVVNNLIVSNGDINRTATAASELQRVGTEIDKIAIYIPEVNNDSSLIAVVYIIIGILFVVLLENFANKNCEIKKYMD